MWKLQEAYNNKHPSILQLVPYPKTELCHSEFQACREDWAQQNLLLWPTSKPHSGCLKLAKSIVLSIISEQASLIKRQECAFPQAKW